MLHKNGNKLEYFRSDEMKIFYFFEFFFLSLSKDKWRRQLFESAGSARGRHASNRKKPWRGKHSYSRPYFRRLESGYTSANVGQRCAAVRGRNSPHKLSVRASSAGDRGRLEALPVGLRTPRVGLVWCAACVRAPAANK